MRVSSAILGILLVPAALPAAGTDAAASSLLYLPPALENSVLFYESFEGEAPDVNDLNAAVSRTGGEILPGMVGRGLRIQPSRKTKDGLTLRNVKFPLNRPVTVSMWWRLDQPMVETSNFHLIGIRGKGWISNFVRGKGKWCALTEPTFIAQVYSWPNVSNWNGRVGKGRVEHGAWHHTAITVSAGSHVCIYWDGVLRADYTIRGRLFSAEDMITSIDVGANWLYHPMTIDDVLVLDRALPAEGISAYIAAARALAERQFPVTP